MTPHAQPSAAVVRLPARLRVVSSDLRTPLSALDALLSSGAIGEREHAAGLGYAALRRQFDRVGGPLRSWRDTSGMTDEAGFERFMLDRLCLDGEAPFAWPT